MACSSLAQEDLECPICTDLFHEPKLLPCGHRVCSACLNNYMKSLNTQGCACPLCKNPFTGNQKFPTDHILQNLIKDRKSLSYGMCRVHGLHQRRYCIACSKPACAECVLECHNHCTNVIPMADATRSIEAHLREFSKEVEKNLMNIKSSEDAASSKMKEIAQRNTESLEQLEKVKVDFVNHVTNMQVTINGANQSSVSQLQGYIGTVKLLMSKTEELDRCLKGSLNSGSSERMSESITKVIEKQGFLRTIPQRLKENIRLTRPLTKMPSVDLGHVSFRKEDFPGVKGNHCLRRMSFLVKLFIILIYLLVFTLTLLISYDRYIHCHRFFPYSRFRAGRCSFIWSA